MSFDDWLKWPTKSTDPGVNFVVLVFLGLLILIAIVVGAAVAVPLLIIAAIAKGVHWYATRPMPTEQLVAQTEQRSITANFPDHDRFLEAHLTRFLEACGERLPASELYYAMSRASGALYRTEDLNNPLPPIPPTDTIEEGRYRDRMLARMRKSSDAPKTLEVFNSTLGTAYQRFLDTLPPLARVTREVFADDETQPFATFPLIDLVADPAHSIMQLITPFYAEAPDELGLFSGLRRQLERNINRASGFDYSPPANKLVWPADFKGTPREMVAAYLGDTPLEDLFFAPIPFSFIDEQRYEHMHVVGGSGHGKTQLLQHLIFNDLSRPSPPSLVVIDSQGEMLRKVQQLALFAPGRPLSERLIIVDPEDVSHPPALNMFDTKASRHGDYSQAVKEQIEASTIEMFNYVFGALAAELTSRQNTTFAFVTRLMVSIPGATIHTLRELFEDGAASIDDSPFAEHIRRLDSTSQAYFQNQFFTKPYSQTKQQIARRLYGVLQVPAFDRMFASRDNKLDMFRAMQEGAIILINTSKALLKSDASALFGRYMIARVIGAAFERVAVAREQRNPAFLIVDEASEYFDDNLETLLSQARKFNVGVLFAHQHLDQLTTPLRASVAANTSVKLAGGISDKDARSLASDMRTTADFITSTRKFARSSEFACHVRNVTTNAVRLEIPFGTLEAADRMTNPEYEQIIQRNRQRYALSPDAPRPVATSPDTPPARAAAGPVPGPSPDEARPEVAPLSKAEDDWRS
jgi:hypothetical protein